MASDVGFVPQHTISTLKCLKQCVQFKMLKAREGGSDFFPPQTVNLNHPENVFNQNNCFLEVWVCILTHCLGIMQRMQRGLSTRPPEQKSRTMDLRGIMKSVNVRTSRKLIQQWWSSSPPTQVSVVLLPLTFPPGLESSAVGTNKVILSSHRTVHPLISAALQQNRLHQHADTEHDVTALSSCLSSCWVLRSSLIWGWKQKLGKDWATLHF